MLAGFISEDLLQRWDSGELLEELNKAVGAWGHRRLRSADGEYMGRAMQKLLSFAMLADAA